MSFLAATVLAVASAVTVVPGPGAAQTTYVIEARDLDLATPQGVEALDGRLRRAISQACHVRQSYSVRDRVRSRLCEREMVVRAAVQRDRLIARAHASRRSLALARE